MYAQPSIDRLGFVCYDEQDWADGDCETGDEEDRNQGRDDRCGLWVCLDEFSQGRDEFCNVVEGRQSAEQRDGKDLRFSTDLPRMV